MNNSKQTVLSIVGIAILVIAVVGVSFAFFTYSRNGQTNNVITTGEIVFDSDIDTVQALSLTNRFPQTDAEGKLNTGTFNVLDQNGDPTGETTSRAYAFNVHGTIPSTANPVQYGVFVEEAAFGERSTNNRFQPSEISIYVTGVEDSTSGGNNDGLHVVERFGADDGVYRLTNKVKKNVSGHENGELIAYGEITDEGVFERHNYTLTMWVNNTVKISDTSGTNEGYQYRAHAYVVDTQHPENNWTEKPAGVDNDNRPVYSDMWYSIKVNVQARDDGVSYASLASGKTDSPASPATDPQQP